MGLGRTHGSANDSTRSDVRRWLLRPWFGVRTPRRFCRREPGICHRRKAVERRRQGSAGIAQPSPKTRPKPVRASRDTAAIAETLARPREGTDLAVSVSAIAAVSREAL